MLVQLRSRVANAEQFEAKLVTEGDVALKLEGDADVYRPDGEPLCILRRGAITDHVHALAYPALHALRKQKTDNRGSYTGAKRTVKSGGSSRTRDETGKTLLVASAIVGYFDRQGGRHPFCRETAFTADQVQLWSTVVPVAQHVARLYEKTARQAYARQCAEIAKVHPSYVIAGTPFTTLTVNNNVAPSGVHKDAGDFKGGLGVISVLRCGQYEGAWLCFPEYRVGVDLRHGDVLFFNSHDWHGVTEMRNKSDDAERISVVYYMRKKMVECLPPKEELARAQARMETPV